MQQDTPQVAKRRAREEKTISQMVALYCAGNHERVAEPKPRKARGEAVLTRNARKLDSMRSCCERADAAKIRENQLRCLRITALQAGNARSASAR